MERAHNGVGRKTLWQVLGMCDVKGGPLNGIKSMYVDGSACVRVKVSSLRQMVG